MAAFARRILAVGESDGARERPVAMVSGSYFEFFDMRPAIGRFFSVAALRNAARRRHRLVVRVTTRPLRRIRDRSAVTRANGDEI